jgi:uncharacterized glyoxalase superfamily metalloenzyme YdcJ
MMTNGDAMNTARGEAALSALLELIQQVERQGGFGEVLPDLRCAETVETAADWHANLEEAKTKLAQMGKRGARVLACVTRIKNRV